MAKQVSSLRTVRYFFGRYPVQSTLVVLAMLAAGIAESLGIGALLPLVSIVLDNGGGAASTGIEPHVRSVFAAIGLPLTLEVLLSVIVGAIVLKALIIFFALRYAGMVAADIARDARIGLIRALMAARWQYYARLPLGRAANAVSEEAQRAGSCYMLACKTISAFIQICVYIAAAFLISWKVSLLAIVLGGLLGFLLKGFIRLAREAGQDMTDSLNALLSGLNEALMGVKPLKAMAQEDRFISQLDRETKAVRAAQVKQYKASLLLLLTYEPVTVLLLAAGLYYVLVFTQIPVSGVFLLAFLFYRLLGYANLMQNNYQNMAQAESAVWGIQAQTHEAHLSAESFVKGSPPALNSGIVFRDVTIAYDAQRPLFENFNAQIPARKITVLFGPSGIGKTTLTDCVLGLMTPAQGNIFIDDINLQQADIVSWRNQVGYVPQETFLFHDSVLRNVTLGDKNFSASDVEAALRAASAWNFVSALPEGINSIVGERGGLLSGGQRQRIAVARAIIRKPSLLILDEATTGLDRESENAILNAVHDLKSSMTVIIISHNEAILKLADHLIDLRGHNAG